MKDNKLDEKKYRDEMEFLVHSIFKVAEENNPQRVVLSGIGQGAFLNGLEDHEQSFARDTFCKTIDSQIKSFKQTENGKKIKVALPDDLCKNTKLSDVERLTNSRINGSHSWINPGDLLVNAWDPHSAPGNGNCSDRSLDGALGCYSSMTLTQMSCFNDHLNDLKKYIPIHYSPPEQLKESLPQSNIDSNLKVNLKELSPVQNSALNNLIGQNKFKSIEVRHEEFDPIKKIASGPISSVMIKFSSIDECISMLNKINKKNNNALTFSECGEARDKSFFLELKPDSLYTNRN